MPIILGLDIGGANLKSALLHTPIVHPLSLHAVSRPFALWRQPHLLSTALRDLMADFTPDLVAVTMTGELCDCFPRKRDGVLFILDAVEHSTSAPVVVWGTDGRFADLATTRTNPLRAAAANWLALAVFAGRFAPRGTALLIDIGSTTTDVVPLLDGHPVPIGRTDPERLRSGELVYTGVRRAPVCALMNGEGAAEFFATIHDVHLILGNLPPSSSTDTADGRPATMENAHARLARMLCADLETSTSEERVRLAQTLAARQLHLISSARNRVVARLPSPPHTTIVAGEGEFLAEQVTANDHTQVIRLSDHFGVELSHAACAVAVAILAAESNPCPTC